MAQYHSLVVRIETGEERFFRGAQHGRRAGSLTPPESVDIKRSETASSCVRG
jgi:hypothetical protein